MAYYTYKDVYYSVPEKYEEKFEEEFHREPDGDPNYNGDCWTIVGMYVADLESKIEELKELALDLGEKEGKSHEEAYYTLLNKILD